MPGDNHLRTAKKGTAILVTTLVQTLEQKVPGFQEAFLERLGQAYAEVRDDDAELDGLELLQWTRSYLTGFDFVRGQGDPFLDGQ